MGRPSFSYVTARCPNPWLASWYSSSTSCSVNSSCGLNTLVPVAISTKTGVSSGVVGRIIVVSLWPREMRAVSHLTHHLKGLNMRTGWHQLIPDAPLFRGPGRFPLDAYSEFLPPPLLGWKPYGDEPPDSQLFDPED